MKTLTKALRTVAGVLTCAIVFADEQKAVDPFSVDAPVVDVPSNPNHLEPIPVYDPDGYDQAVFKSLLGKSPGEMWMIGKPSFSPEYAVVLRHEVKYAHANATTDPFVDRVIESEKWVVEYVEAKRKIWRWKHLKGGRMELDIKVTKEVIRSRVDVTGDFAGSMISAWRSVLQQTRYSEEIYRGCDGATYQFYCGPNLFGEIWSPSSGGPLQITNLGHKLRELAKSEVENRPPLILECITLAKDLTPTKKSEQGADGKTPEASQSSR